MDLKAQARQLGRAVQETPEFKAAKQARAKVEEHEAARIMLKDFEERQEKYRQAVLAGKAGEADAKALEELAGIVALNPYLRELLGAEARLAELVVGLQREMMAAAGLSQPAEAAGGGDGQRDG